MSTGHVVWADGKRQVVGLVGPFVLEDADVVEAGNCVSVEADEDAVANGSLAAAKCWAARSAFVLGVNGSRPPRLQDSIDYGNDHWSCPR